MLGQWETVSADRIEQHPANANNGDIDAIHESLMVNGCYRPVYVSSESRRIVAGHHLYQALVKAGVEDIPVQWVDGLDETGELRILAADNQVAALAQIDESLMLDLLHRLAETDDGLGGTGFTMDDLTQLEADQEGGLGFGAGMEDLTNKLTDDVTCPNCGHVFELVIGE